MCIRDRRSTATAPACALDSRVRAELARKGSDIKVLDRAITVGEIRRIAQRNGLTGQFERALKRLGK